MTSFEIYSIGIVTKAKERNSNEIDVYPVEILPLAEGDLTLEDVVTGKTSIKVDGVDIESEAVRQKTVRAKWLPFGVSNRATPPDVMQNETVILFRYADTGNYYWTTIFSEPTIRRVETVVYVYGNEPKPDKILSKDNTHWFMVSAHDKMVWLHTSNNNEEACTYDIRLNLKEGSLTVADNLSNTITLKSVDGHLQADIREKVTVNTPIIETNGSSVTINAKDDVTVNTDKAVINANVSADVKTKTFTVEADSSTIKSPAITLDGDTNITGSLTAPTANLTDLSTSTGNIDNVTSSSINTGSITAGTYNNLP